MREYHPVYLKQKVNQGAVMFAIFLVGLFGFFTWLGLTISDRTLAERQKVRDHEIIMKQLDAVLCTVSAPIPNQKKEP